MSEPAGLLLDTHIWVNYINGDPVLRKPVIAKIDEARRMNSIYVSVISVWEIAFLARKKKLILPLSALRWSEEAMRLPGTHLLALSPEIAVRSVDLPKELNKDPADRFLVATAEIHRLRLVTRDQNVIAFAKSNKLLLLTA